MSETQQTRYWSRKNNHFACKCDVQETAEDGRILREWTNPQTNEPGSTWEWHRDEFDGLIEYIDLKKGDYGWDFYMGIQGSMRVNVLQFKVFDAKSRMIQTLIPVIRKVTNIDPTIPIHVSLFTPENQGQYEKTYTVLKQADRGVKEAFKKDPVTKRFIGIPEPEVKEGIGGSKVYDFLPRDKFLFEHLQTWVERNKEVFRANKEKRPPTDAEKNNPPEPTPEVEAAAKDPLEGDYIQF